MTTERRTTRTSSTTTKVTGDDAATTTPRTSRATPKKVIFTFDDVAESAAAFATQAEQAAIAKHNDLVDEARKIESTQNGLAIASRILADKSDRVKNDLADAAQKRFGSTHAPAVAATPAPVLEPVAPVPTPAPAVAATPAPPTRTSAFATPAGGISSVVVTNNSPTNSTTVISGPITGPRKWWAIGLVAWLVAICSGMAVALIMVLLSLHLSGFNTVYYFLLPLLAFFAGGFVSWKTTEHRSNVAPAPASNVMP